MEDFIADLDEYFINNYTNMREFVALDGYVLPDIPQTTAEGERAAKLIGQKQPLKLLREWKVKYSSQASDLYYRAATLGERFRAIFARKSSFCGALKALIARYGGEGMDKRLNIESGVWQNLLSGKTVPFKRVIFDVCLELGATYEECGELLALIGAVFSDEKPRDVVVSYLLKYKVYNREKVLTAFGEYGLNK